MKLVLCINYGKRDNNILEISTKYWRCRTGAKSDNFSFIFTFPVVAGRLFGFVPISERFVRCCRWKASNGRRVVNWAEASSIQRSEFEFWIEQAIVFALFAFAFFHACGPRRTIDNVVYHDFDGFRRYCCGESRRQWSNDGIVANQRSVSEPSSSVEAFLCNYGQWDDRLDGAWISSYDDRS